MPENEDAIIHNALEMAKEAVEKACRVARFVASNMNDDNEYRRQGTLGKADTSPVTVADFAVQAVICHHLMNKMDDHPICIMAEEDAKQLRENKNNMDLLDLVVQAVLVVQANATRQQVCDWIDLGTARRAHNNQQFWTLDPIDGTKGFLRRQQYAICLAYIRDGVPVVGVMGCPNLSINIEKQQQQQQQEEEKGVLFFAYQGGGAFQIPISRSSSSAVEQTPPSVATAIPIHSKSDDTHEDNSKLQFCESVEAAHSNHELSHKIASILGITSPPVRLDSQVKYAVLARGEADLYLRLPNNYCISSNSKEERKENIWDHAAGAVILTQAGGVITDMNGMPLDFTHGTKLVKNQGVVASSSPNRHKKLLKAIETAVQHN